MKRLWVGFALSILALLASSRLAASEVVFENGFESGTACGWASANCSLASLLGQLESANTSATLDAALLASLEATGGSVLPEIATAINAAADLGIQYPSTRGAFLTIQQAHELATLSQSTPPSLQEALSALSTEVQVAYANPGATSSKAIVLMFSSTTQMPSPLPLTGSSSQCIDNVPDPRVSVVASFGSSMSGRYQFDHRQFRGGVSGGRKPD